MGLAFREGAAGASSHLSHGKGPSEPPAGNGGPDSRRYRARACALLRKFRWNHGQFVRPEPIGSGRFCFLGARQEAGGMDEAYQNQTGAPPGAPPAAASGPSARDPALDAVRALAIVLVVMTHAASPGFSFPIGSGNWWGAMAWGTLARASVPLFFMCSGALMLGRDIPLRRLYGHNLSDWWRRCTFGHSFTGCTT